MVIFSDALGAWILGFLGGAIAVFGVLVWLSLVGLRACRCATVVAAAGAGLVLWSASLLASFHLVREVVPYTATNVAVSGAAVLIAGSSGAAAYAAAAMARRLLNEPNDPE